VRISTEDDMTLFAGRGARCGFAFFDTTELTDVERRHLGAVDRVFVTSEWSRAVAIANGIDAQVLHKVPLGVDGSMFMTADPPGDGRTVFLHVGAWQRRKGQDVLLDAFERAFRPGDAVELRLLSSNPWSQLSDRWIDECQASPMRDHITVLPRVRDHREVAEFMRAADCGVYPARSEAWNLEPLEMLACGRHVIATNFAGHTEFLDHENALLIDIDELEPANDPVWMPVFGTRKTGEWAHLGARQVDQLITHLRSVHERKQCGELGMNEAGIRTAVEFSWDGTARALVAGLP
jgi:glycosyltransferase involved in cell wall biosynthesis